MKLPNNSNQEPSWLLRSPRRLAIVVFILVGLVSLLGVAGIEDAAAMRRRAALERNAAEIGAALRQLDAEHEIYLRASAALLASQVTVTAQNFVESQRQLNFARYSQGFLGVGWAVRTPTSAVAHRPTALYPQASYHHRVHPNADRRDDDSRMARDRTTAVPIAFISPPTIADVATVSFDSYSEPMRRTAMDHAAAIDAPVATGQIQLLHSGRRAPQSGFVIYMPVFGHVAARPVDSSSAANGVSQPTTARGVLRGFVFMPARAQDLLALANHLSERDSIRIAAYDGKVEPGRLMAQLGPAAVGTQLIEHVSIANRPWQLVVTAERPDGLSRLSQIIILSGLIVALLLVALIRLTYQKINEERQLLEWRASESGIRNSLTRELNHRVKNTLATVLSIIAVTRRRESDIDSYVASLSGRILALSATHDLLTSNDWSTVELRQIIVVELAPYIGVNDDHVSLDGPDIRLAPNDSLSLGLALHELATNAAKFGALSVLSGRVAVRWSKLNDDLVEVHWQETDGPAVSEPSKRGFGRDLIEKILARELDAPVKLDFAPGGLRCAFQVPLRTPGKFVLRTAANSQSPARRNHGG